MSKRFHGSRINCLPRPKVTAPNVSSTRNSLHPTSLRITFVTTPIILSLASSGFHYSWTRRTCPGAGHHAAGSRHRQCVLERWQGWLTSAPRASWREWWWQSIWGWWRRAFRERCGRWNGRTGWGTLLTMMTLTAWHFLKVNWRMGKAEEGWKRMGRCQLEWNGYRGCIVLRGLRGWWYQIEIGHG